LEEGNCNPQRGRQDCLDLSQIRHNPFQATTPGPLNSSGILSSAVVHLLLYVAPMTAEAWVRLIEELIDLKLARFAEANMKLSPELARLLQDKRDTDRQRLQQVRAELVRTLQGY